MAFQVVLILNCLLTIPIVDGNWVLLLLCLALKYKYLLFKKKGDADREKESKE